MKQLLTTLLLLLGGLALNAQGDEAALERALFLLPDVQFEKITKPTDKFPKYRLRIRQPLDHSDTSQGWFWQRAVLTHKGYDRAIVMETEGYEGRTGGNEIEKILGANNLNVEHRFFGSSRPDSLQWQYLTYAQVLADLHYVNALLRRIYTGKWISTGISRGGQTAIFYKAFYPKDIDVAVPYVAPIPNAVEDRRIYTFLDTIGTPECRAKIFAVQRFLLQHEAEAVSKLKWYAKGKGLSFAHFGSIEKAFEMWVLEYPFSFWQIGHTPCAQIPTNRSVDDYLDHLISGVGGIEFMADKSVNEWAANAYMAHGQGGYYSYDLSRFRPYLKYLKGDNPSGALLPAAVPQPRFDSSFILRIASWLDTAGNNILYIYGSTDTWSACRVTPSANVNSKLFWISGVNHYDARIRNMPIAMKEEFAAALRSMLGVEPNMKVLETK
ncbi:MAG: hypothetical protein EOO15_07750 [Chitinophagaceae bacterium]|nr:MAG: hypothetical protein EOO15_07750 [Chitinophagaceae bacterium]